MQETFKVLGLSFKNTPLLVREKLALDEVHVKKMLKFIGDFTPATDVLVLSTCNRTEVYYSSDSDLTTEILKGLSLIKGIDEAVVAEYFISCTDHNEAVRRLFNVSMGLEAQVVGDLQISNQVKTAYQWSADEAMAGPFLHRLMHTIFFTNKRVVQETSFRDGAASVSYAAKELTEDITSGIDDPRVLILGLGEIGRDVCRNLADSRIKNIVIANRTEEKAAEMATETGFGYIPFARVGEAIQDADVIISSIALDKPFITKELVEKLEILSFKFFIDLSVPRSVEVTIEEVPGALVYNIDNIQNKTSEALQKRIDAVPDVKRIIAEAIDEFNDWSKEMIVSPTIKKLKNALEDIRREELARYLKDADSKEAKILDKVTKSMMQKIMKLPVLQLKAACRRGDAESLIDVLHDLFDLEKQSSETK